MLEKALPREGKRGLVKSRRYNLSIAAEMDAELQRVSRKHNIPVPELIRRYTQLGLIEDKAGPFRFKDEDGNWKEIELFPPDGHDQRKKRLWKKE